MADQVPISTARRIADEHGYDQVIILARRVGEPGLEWVTTYGKNPAHCYAAARIGDALRNNVTPTLERLRAALGEWKCPSCGGTGRYMQRSKSAGANLVECRVCAGKGLDPKAAAALEGDVHG